MSDRSGAVLPAPRSRVRARAALAVVVGTALAIAGCSPPPTATPTSPEALTAPTPTAVVSPTPSRGVPPTPRAAPTPEPLAMTRSAPVRVEVPSIGVDSELMELGLRADGAMEVPPEAFPAGWYTGAPTPGELGPAVIAGHIDWVTGPAVFADLSEVAVDDEIVVTREDGTRAVFRVASTGQYAKDAFPTAEVYGNLDHAGLRLISCGGSWDTTTRHYRDNIVVFAELVDAD